MRTVVFPPGEIHIHVLRMEDENISVPLEELQVFLSSEERSRFLGFELEDRRIEFLWSRLLVRYVLASYLGKDPRDLSFGYRGHGKPFLEHSGIQFNLSHTAGLVACSIGFREVGVDVEKVTVRGVGRMNWRLLASRYFSEVEKEHLFSQEPGNQVEFFFRIFTLKEALLKASGKGWGVSPCDFSVPLPLREKSSSGPWECWAKLLEPGHFCLAHVAENRGGAPLGYRFCEWNRAAFSGFLQDFFQLR